MIINDREIIQEINSLNEAIQDYIKNSDRILNNCKEDIIALKSELHHFKHQVAIEKSTDLELLSLERRLAHKHHNELIYIKPRFDALMKLLNVTETESLNSLIKGNKTEVIEKSS